MPNEPDAEDPTCALFYREHAQDLSLRKSMKVRIPLRQHVRLHAMKLFSESKISEMVEAALDDYFQKVEAASDAAGALPAARSGAAGACQGG